MPAIANAVTVKAYVKILLYFAKQVW